MKIFICDILELLKSLKFDNVKLSNPRLELKFYCRGKYTAIFLDNHPGKVLEKLTAGEEFYEK